jgi:amphi-Trp domain-containing protein
MKQENDKFRHESMQDRESIQSLLKAVAKGIGKGKVNFGDEKDEIVMSPEGLLHLKITASRDDRRQRINIRITWQDEDQSDMSEKLRVTGG